MGSVFEFDFYVFFDLLNGGSRVAVYLSVYLDVLAIFPLFRCRTIELPKTIACCFCRFCRAAGFADLDVAAGAGTGCVSTVLSLLGYDVDDPAAPFCVLVF